MTTLPRDNPAQSTARLWILRILIRLGAYKRFVRDNEVADDEVARLIGLDDLTGRRPQGAKPFDRQEVIDRLHALWMEAEQAADDTTTAIIADHAIVSLGKALGLSGTETDILCFRVSASQTKELRSVLNGCLGPVGFSDVTGVFSICLNLSESGVSAALAFGSRLMASGIIELNFKCGCSFDDAVSLLGCLLDEIHCKHEDPIMYFRSRIARSPAPRLAAEHFPHVGRDLDILRRYIADAITKRRAGVNVLIHGEPGSGKTEFARMLAADLAAELYEIASARRDGREMDGQQRFRAYRLGQALFNGVSGRMILFDEIEDIFQESDTGHNTGANSSNRKALVNKTLEDNPVPAFWISNNIHVIDRAHLRRFDYVLEMKVPPRSVRGRILEDYLAGMPVSDAWKRRMAEHEELVPAIVERAAKVIQVAKEAMPPEEAECALARAIGNTLEVMGLARSPRTMVSLGNSYRLDALNADCDMGVVLAGLNAHRQGRLCLYGPPGTGKTAFGQHVADTLDRPLLVRRASDIISPWIGMTEKNLARMFRQAEEENAVLLLDEADSFLQDRQGAQRSWEITEVNEMLTQMEGFEGIFIASTNLMASLDSAALRRFDLKIRFDYLKPHQAWALFADTRSCLHIPDESDMESAMARLDCLTPGDFANVLRQARLRPIATSGELLDRLRSECAIKPEGRRQPIGFLP